MKILVILLTSVFVWNAFAGGTGGGGVLDSVENQTAIGNGSEIFGATWVRYKEMDRADIVFDYRQVGLDGVLRSGTLKKRAEEISSEKLQSAIQESAQIKNWKQVR